MGVGKTLERLYKLKIAMQAEKKDAAAKADEQRTDRSKRKQKGHKKSNSKQNRELNARIHAVQVNVVLNGETAVAVRKKLNVCTAVQGGGLGSKGTKEKT